MLLTLVSDFTHLDPEALFPQGSADLFLQIEDNLPLNLTYFNNTKKKVSKSSKIKFQQLTSYPFCAFKKGNLSREFILKKL